MRPDLERCQNKPHGTQERGNRDFARKIGPDDEKNKEDHAEKRDSRHGDQPQRATTTR